MTEGVLPASPGYRPAGLFADEQVAPAKDDPVEVLYDELVFRGSRPTLDERKMSRAEVESITKKDPAIRRAALRKAEAAGYYWIMVSSGKRYGDLVIYSPLKALAKAERDVTKHHVGLDRIQGQMKSIEPDLGIENRPRAQAIGHLAKVAAEMLTPDTVKEAVEVIARPVPGRTMDVFIANTIAMKATWR